MSRPDVSTAHHADDTSPRARSHFSCPSSKIGARLAPSRVSHSNRQARATACLVLLWFVSCADRVCGRSRCCDARSRVHTVQYSYDTIWGKELRAASFCFFILYSFPTFLLWSRPFLRIPLFLLLLASFLRARLGLRRGVMSADQCLSLASRDEASFSNIGRATGVGGEEPRGFRRRIFSVSVLF